MATLTDPNPQPSETSGASRSVRWWLAAILLLAFSLRVGIGLAFPSSDFPDEIFQTREPAHRLAYGYGLVTWDFRDGIRNWVFPAFLAGVMRATDCLGPGSLGYNLGILLVLSAVSLSVVATGFWWGYRSGGLVAAIITGATCALWYELIYYAPQALNEVIAVHLLVPGLYLACFPAELDGVAGAEARGVRWGRFVVAGALCGTALGLRIHLLPAIAVTLLLTCRRSGRKWAAMLAGLSPPLLLFGMVDWLTWGAPFASYWRAININIFQHKSITYGQEPALWLIVQVALHFGPIAVLMVPGLRRAPAPALVAISVLATHSAFGHKEYRYIYPAVPLLCILLGLGIAAIFAGIRRPAWLAAPRARVAAALVFLAGVSALWGVSYGTWDRQAGYIHVYREMSLRPDVCGVGLKELREGGYAFLHRDVPLYLLRDPFPHSQAAFNYAAAWYLDPSTYPNYRLQGCWSDFCLYRREGGCVAPPGYDPNHVLKRLGE